MQDTLAPAAQIHAAAAQFSGKTGTMLRPMGWNLVAAQTFGISGGGVLKGAAGFMDIGLQREGMPFYYVLRGGYGELGVGAGVSFSKFMNKSNAAGLAQLQAASNASFSLPEFLSSASPFYCGPTFDGRTLSAASDFEDSNWIYLNAAFMSILIGMEVGILMLMEPQFSFETRMFPPGTDILTALVLCQAFCFYFGTDGGLLPSVGIGERYIKIYATELQMPRTGEPPHRIKLDG